MTISFAAAADDDTGATDLAGMLADRGMRAVLILDNPSRRDFERWTAEADAVVIGTASRSIAVRDAYEKTHRAVQLLRTTQPAVLEIKYCSTFDSTPHGNIGPSIDAAMDETGESFTVALPALPVNGRTTYMGYHFVGQQLLSDSSMRNHPLTPMTNPNLVTHLQSQTKRRVGLLPFPVVSQGAIRIQEGLKDLRSEGVQIAVLDCTSEKDLESICSALADVPLITGSSAPAMYLPRFWSSHRPRQVLHDGRSEARGFLVVAGSYSEATRHQNSWLASQEGVTVVTLDALSLARSKELEIAPGILRSLAAGGTCLLQVSRDRERVQDYFQREGKTQVEAGELISQGLAHVTREVIERTLPEGLIIAGGETSSTISRVLGFGALRVGRNIEPGIPLCVSLNEPTLPVVFKSGNFGSEDFYRRAIEAIRSVQNSSEPPN